MRELEYPFDEKKILRNRKKLKKMFDQDSGYIEKRIAILAGSTIGEFQHILELFLLNNGIKPVFWQGQYNRFYEESVFNNEELIEFKPDLIYIHTTVKNLNIFPKSSDDKDSVERIIDEECQKYVQIWETLFQKVGCPIIQNNFELLPYRILGNADVYQPFGRLRFINLINSKFAEYAMKYQNLYINDLNYEASLYGLNNWFDNTIWSLYKYAFALEAIPIVAYNVANIIKSLYGKNKKVLVMDLDNTLWGGVIGDCGAEKIKIGIETAEGMLYSEFQKYIKNLAENGIMLAVCSKNENEIAKEGFLNPASVLRLEDFLIFKANWEDKNRNVEEIIQSLNVMPDSVVFIDDNPLEREIVKNNIPEVAVPDLDIVQNYVDILDKQGFFEMTLFSQDDKKRNEYYKANIKRENLKNSFRDYNEYLKSLCMKAFFNSINSDNIERVVQLINKTNQFNLTTKRYTYEEVLDYIKNDSINLVVKLTDKFGENGIISCLMASVQGNIASIDLWVMSCRVFKRDLEKVIFDELIAMCQKRKINTIRGAYFKSKKNGYVEHLYEELGFEKIEYDELHSVYELKIPQTYQKKNEIMEVYYE